MSCSLYAASISDKIPLHMMKLKRFMPAGNYQLFMGLAPLKMA